MAENSAIEWCDHTFNPWIGCAKVSPGCKHCYAETLMDTRYGRVEWGVHGTRVRTGPDNWKKPLRWNRQAEAEGRRYRVFCASLADVFEDRDELEPWRRDLLALIYQTPRLDWLLLTKRPENVMRMLYGFMPPNLWIGTSVENQETADERIPELLKIPATVRFLSCEPLLGPVDLTPWLGTGHPTFDPGVDWVIVGGESGPKARPFDVRWAWSLVEQCADAGVPCFVKQLGDAPFDSKDDGYLPPTAKKGGDMSEWLGGLRVRQFPRTEGQQ